MIQNFAIDQAATFESLLFLSCEPKTAFGDSVPAGDDQGRHAEVGGPARRPVPPVRAGHQRDHQGRPRRRAPARRGPHAGHAGGAGRLRDRRDGQEGPRRQRHRRPGLVPLPGGPLHSPPPPRAPGAARLRAVRGGGVMSWQTAGRVPRRRPGAVLPALRRRHDAGDRRPPLGSPSRRSAAGCPVATRVPDLRRSTSGQDYGIWAGTHAHSSCRAIRRARAGRRPGPGRRRRTPMCPALLAAVRRARRGRVALLGLRGEGTVPMTALEHTRRLEHRSGGTAAPAPAGPGCSPGCGSGGLSATTRPRSSPSPTRCAASSGRPAPGCGICQYVQVAAGVTVRTPRVGEVRLGPPTDVHRRAAWPARSPATSPQGENGARLAHTLGAHGLRVEPLAGRWVRLHCSTPTRCATASASRRSPSPPEPRR